MEVYLVLSEHGESKRVRTSSSLQTYSETSACSNLRIPEQVFVTCSIIRIC